MSNDDETSQDLTGELIDLALWRTDSVRYALAQAALCSMQTRQYASSILHVDNVIDVSALIDSSVENLLNADATRLIVILALSGLIWRNEEQTRRLFSPSCLQ
jgi:hypothetical protein